MKTIIFIAAALVSLSPLAHGQAKGEASPPIIFSEPPAGFDPVTAADSELAENGYPPRPALSDPGYAAWHRMVTAPQKRLSNLTVQTTNKVNGGARGRLDREATANSVSSSSNNWSGYVVTAPNGTFTSNDSYVYAEWVVPAAGVDSCGGETYASSQWVGFDGWTSGDVLQAGTAITACGASYVAWYEWFTPGCTANSASLPCYQWNFSLAVNPGDRVSTEVWYTTAAPHGHAYMVNYSTQQSASMAFNQPSGSTGSGYVGNDAEWIVERPGQTVGNTTTLDDLADYVAVAMNTAHASNYNGLFFYPSSVPSGSTIYNVTMTCPTWTPSSSCPSTTGLSYADLYGTWTLWFYDEGPAYQ